MINSFDLRYSVSRLIADYKFTLTVVITMALGLAVSLFLFSQVYSMGYKSLPFKDGDRIVSITRKEKFFSPPVGGLRYYEGKYFLDNQTTLDNYSVFEMSNAIIATEQFTERFAGARVSDNFFALLNVEPQLGRTFSADDFKPNSAGIAIISDKMWQKLFQRDPNVIGTEIKVGGWPQRIIGVMPKGFEFPISQDFWVRFDQMHQMTPNGEGWLTALGMLKPGVTQEQAADNFLALSNEMHELYPAEFKGKSVKLNTLPGAFAESNKLVISAMTIVAAAILLMGCTSIANLLVVRMLEQRKDTMVKLAVGLPFWRVALVPILESLWLCLVAGLLGMALCILAIKYASQHAFSALGPFWWHIDIGAPLWFAGGAFVLFIWIITGSLPVLMSLKTPTNSVLAGGRKGGGSNKSGRFMSVLIAAQVTCAFLLMTITGISSYNFVTTLTADYGVNPDGYLAATLKPPGASYPEISDRVNYYRQLEQELLTVSGVESVGYLGALPSRFSNNGTTYSRIDQDLSSREDIPRAGSISTDIKAFDALNIPLLDGRQFHESDDLNSEPVAIINESMARDVWPDESAVGKQIQQDPDKHGDIVTIVGVAKDVIFGYPSQRVAKSHIIYRPMQQVQFAWAGMEVAIKVNGDLQAAIPKLIEAARRVDPLVPLLDLVPYEERMNRNANGVKTLIYNFLPAAILALIMAAIGIYGISARLILQRTSDIGIMRALGAKDGHINKLFMTRSLWQILAGIIPGIILLFVVLPQLLQQLEMSKSLFASLSGIVILVVAAIVLFASYMPLHRANRLTPQDALNS